MKKVTISIIILILLLMGYGLYSGYKWLFPKNSEPIAEENINESDLPPADPSVLADISKSSTKADTVILKVSGIEGKYKNIKYEFTYDSGGVIKGVNSGREPLDMSGKNIFEREIYLGTCSKNVCTPDKGVNSLSVFLIFTANDGKMSQLNVDFTI